MARLAVLTDRLPSDTDWKGAYIWRLILGLAESQHDVTVFTTLDPALIPCEHPRLNIAQPADSWRLDRLISWLQALMGFKPEVIHTFAPAQAGAWAALSIWPYLNSAFQVLPNVQRVCTLFEASDFNHARAASPWLLGAHRWTIFTAAQKSALHASFKGEIEVAPMELTRLEALEGEESLQSDSSPARRLIIPAAVEHWRQPLVDLCLLADFLQNHREVQVEIIGGWGRMTSAQKREGWDLLRSVSHQVTLSAPVDFERFQNKVAQCQGLWLRALVPDSWPYFVSQQLAAQYQKPVFGAKLQLTDGSTANFMSRLYTNS